MPHSKLHLGKINYLNCWPLFNQLPKLLNPERFNLISGHPARLNTGLKEGQIDISPSSSMLLAADDTDNDYFILPDITIASLTEVRSVILLSRRPLAELTPGTIALTNQSLTSIFLLKIILFHFQKLNPDKLTFTTCEFSTDNFLPDAALIIGDQALRLYHNPPPGYQVYDLGRLWYEFTGLPFVYALWIGRKSALENKRGAIADLYHALKEIIAGLPDKFAGLTAQALTETRNSDVITPSQLTSYWEQALSYRLEQKSLAGLELFYQLARELGLIRQVPKLEFFPEPESR